MTTLGLPAVVDTCLFDLDGVLTKTAQLHAAAWKQMFDAFLLERAAACDVPFVPFDAGYDYDTYVDGKERNDGVRSFLMARGIDLPEDSVVTLGNRKNELVLEMLRRRGVEPYEGSVRFMRAARAAGLRSAVVSSSTNCRDVLEAAGIASLLDARVDALTAVEQQLAPKPSPDMFVAAARLLGSRPETAAVFEDSLAGVEAGRAGGFALVVGVDRVGQRSALRAKGADVVVSDLEELIAEV